jgi:uncharacterized protein (DUF2252 family)
MSNIRRRLDKVMDTLNDKNISNEAFKHFRDVTPVRSGYARSQTRLNGNTIDANYPYAKVLDKGRHMTNRGMRGSTQAPEGMSKPTLEYIREYVYNTLGIRI